MKRVSTPKPHAPRNPWEEKVDAFYFRINTPFSKKKYGEYERSRIGRALKGKSELEIRELFKACARAKSFGGLFRSLTEKKKEV